MRSTSPGVGHFLSLSLGTLFSQALFAQALPQPPAEALRGDPIPILGQKPPATTPSSLTAQSTAISSNSSASPTAELSSRSTTSALQGLHLFSYQPLQGQSPRRLAMEESTDKSILSMDPYYTFGKRIQLSKEELLSPAGRLNVAKARYLNPVYQKTLGPLAAIPGFLANIPGGWNPNAPEALLLYEQDEQIRRNREMNDLISLDCFGRGSSSRDKSPERPLSQTQQKNPSDNQN